MQGQQSFAVQTLLRIYFMQQWFRLSEPAMEGARHDVPAFRDYAGLSYWDEQSPSNRASSPFHVADRHAVRAWRYVEGGAQHAGLHVAEGVTPHVGARSLSKRLLGAQQMPNYSQRVLL